MTVRKNRPNGSLSWEGERSRDTGIVRDLHGVDLPSAADISTFGISPGTEFQLLSATGTACYQLSGSLSWEPCATGSVASVSGGDGISVSGTPADPVIDLDAGVNDGDILFWNGAAWAIAGGTAAEGEVLKFLSGVPAWDVAGGGTVTGVSASAPLEITGGASPAPNVKLQDGTLLGSMLFWNGSNWVRSAGDAAANGLFFGWSGGAPGWISAGGGAAEIPIQDGSAATPGLNFASDLDTGLYRTAQHMFLGTGGVARVGLLLGEHTTGFGPGTFGASGTTSDHCVSIDCTAQIALYMRTAGVTGPGVFLKCEDTNARLGQGMMELRDFNSGSTTFGYGLVVHREGSTSSHTDTYTGILLNVSGTGTSALGLGLDVSVSHGTARTGIRIAVADVALARGIDLSVSSGTTRHAIYSQGTAKSYFNGPIGIKTATPAYDLELANDSAGKPTTSTWTVVSDKRTKRDIRALEHGQCERIRKLKPVHYCYNGKRGTPEGAEGVGFTAQEIEKVFPEAVVTRADGTKSLNLHPVLISTIQAVMELTDEVAALKKGGGTIPPAPVKTRPKAKEHSCGSKEKSKHAAAKAVPVRKEARASGARKADGATGRKPRGAPAAGRKRGGSRGSDRTCG